ncbi:MAG: GNAT family N-acetyltransferase [Pseudomonadota bacterium]
MRPVLPVLVLHNQPRADAGYAESDAGVLDEVAAVLAALADLGIPARSAGIIALGDLPDLLAAAAEPVVFNLVEALAGPPEDVNRVPDLILAAGKACTGNPRAALAACLDKAHAKAVLAAAGLPVPAGVVVLPGDPVPALPFAGPCIVKPALVDASEGIHAASAVHPGPGPGLSAAVAALHARFGQPVLVEALCDGLELNVAVLEEDGAPRVLAIAAIDFVDFPPELPRIVDYDAKWRADSFAFTHTTRVLPAPIDPGLAQEVEALALAAWRAVGCRGYARVDLRTDRAGRPVVLEVNPNPDISPDSGYAAALAHRGRNHRALVRAALAAALRPPVVIRPTVATDRDPILAAITATGFFPAFEVEVAREVLDDAIAGKDDGHYRSYTALLGERPVGWACLGPTPCTVGTWDFYWMAVHPEAQGRGIGRRLVTAVEACAREAGGRMVIIETAGRSQYDPTRAAYLACGYHEAARIADFYADGDDKVVYVRRVDR